MSKMKGPAIFLAQFASGEAPFNTLEGITRWAGELGYKGVQIPSWEAGLIDLTKAAQSKDYCDELKGICADNGVETMWWGVAKGLGCFLLTCFWGE